MQATSTPEKLWNRDFALFWLGTAQSSFGSSLAGIAMSFLILELTGSAASMGINLALAILPGLFAPLAGNWIDRLPLKPPLVVGDLLRGAVVLGVWFLATQGQITVPVIYLATVLTSVIGVIYSPAASKLIPELVPPKELPRANGLLGTATQSMNLLGLVGGGVLVSQLGTALALLIDAVSFFVMAGVLALVRMPGRPASAGRTGFWQSLGEGFKVIARSRVLTLIPVMAFLLNACFAPIMMLVPKMMNDLGLGAQGYGFFMGAFSLGIVLGNVAVSVLGARIRPAATFGLGLAAMGVTMAAIGWVPQVWQMYLLAVLTGLANGVVNPSLVTLLQTLVAPEFRGRVFGVLGSVGQLGMPITLLALAGFVDRIDPHWVFTVSGLMSVLMALVWAAFGREPKPSPTLTQA